jgi:hypothetical protein
MASRTSSEPSPGLQQLAHRDSQRVAEAVQNVEGRVVMTLGVRDLPDRFPTKAGELCELPVRQLVTCSPLVDVYAVSQSYRVVGSSFLLPLGYWGYPRISSTGAAPRFRGRALGTTSAGSCPPGRHLRQSCEPVSDGALLLIQRSGNWGIVSGAHAFLPICVSFTGPATGTGINGGTIGQRRALESARPLVVGSWRRCNHGAGSLSGPLATGRDA